MALQDYYNTGQDGFHGSYEAWEVAQTFTPQDSYQIGSVKLYVKRLGTITNIIVGIYETVDGHPIGEALCSKSVDVSGWSDSSFAWREWEFAVNPQLDADSKYAIWIQGTGYDVDNCLIWGNDGTSPTYVGGAMEYDFGFGWVTDSPDCLFETYSVTVPIGLAGSFSETFNIDGSLSVTTQIAGSAAGTSGASGFANHQFLDGSLAQTSNVSGSLNSQIELGSSIVEISSVGASLGSLGVLTLVVAPTVGTSGADGFLRLSIIGLVGSATGGSGASAVRLNTVLLAGDSAGGSDGEATLDSQPGLGSSAVEISSAGAFLGSLGVLTLVVAPTVGASGGDGSLDSQPEIIGSLISASAVSASLDSQSGLVGSVVGTFDASAFLNFTYLSFEQSEDSGQPIELFYFINTLNSEVWSYNNSDSDIVYNGVTYSTVLIRRGDIQLSSNSLKSQVEIGVSSSNPFARNYIQEPMEGIVQLTIYRQHLGSYVTYWKGSIASVKFKPKIAIVIANLKISSLKRFGLMLKFQRNCGLPLYSTRCDPLEVLKNSKKVTGTIFSVNGATIISTDFLDPAEDGWFVGGIFKTDNDSCLQKIIYHVGSTIKIARPVSALAAGDDFTAWAGCDHSEIICDSRFDNSLNYGGQLHIPDKNPFTGDPIA